MKMIRPAKEFEVMTYDGTNFIEIAQFCKENSPLIRHVTIQLKDAAIQMQCAMPMQFAYQPVFVRLNESFYIDNELFPCVQVVRKDMIPSQEVKQIT